MRKRIATLLLAFALILPCSLFFTACGENDDPGEAKVTSIAVELATTNYTMTDNTITIPWGGKVELDYTKFTVTATLENSETKVISKKTDSSSGYNFASDIPSDEITPIGEYLIVFSHEQVDGSIEIDVNVVKADVDMSGVSWNYTNVYTYDKTEKVVELTGLPQGVEVSYQGTTRATNAGEYTATAIFTYSDTEHYNAIPSKVLSWEIEKATIVIDAIFTQPVTYDGTEKTVQVSTSNLPENVEIATITGETTKTDAGIYQIEVSFVYVGDDANNYNPIANLSWGWSISKAIFTQVGEVTLANSSDIIYNGETQTVELNYTGLDSDNVEVVNVTGNTAKNVGTYSAVVELNYIGENENYDRVNNILVEWEIKKAPLTVKANNKTITYGDSAANDGVTYTGFVGEETSSVLVGTLAYNYGEYVVGSNVGSYEITPSGLTSSNYEITFEKGSLIVEKKNLTISVNNVTIGYNSEATNNGVAPVGLIPSDTVSKLGTLVYNYGNYVKGSPVGSYEITVSGLDDTNYNITYIKGTLTVQKIDVPVDVTGIALVQDVFTYTGEEFSVEVDESTIPEDVVVTNVITRDKTAINADEYVAVIYLQYVDTTNYNPMPEITRTWKIEKATVASFDGVKLNVNELVYNGLQQEVEILNIPTGAKIDIITGNTGIVVDEYTVEVTFVCADETNYNNFDAVTKSYTWNITPAELVVAANDNSIEYLEEITNNGYTVTGFVNNETESVLKGKVTFSYTYSAGQDVGSYKILVSGLTADNYTIEFVNGNLEVTRAKINVAELEWNISAEVEYSGEEILPEIIDLPSVIVAIYSYTRLGDRVTPINVGEYVASAALELNNNNYEIVGSFADLEFRIIRQKIDGSSLIWTDEREFTFNGEEIKPTLKKELENLEITYSYFIGEDTQTEAENVINAGTYTATVTVRVNNDNYELINYTDLENITFEIQKLEIDITGLIWVVEEEYIYTGTAYTPELNEEIIESEHLTFEYFYIEGEIVNYPVKELIQESSINPINAGSYTAFAFFNFAYDYSNYNLVNNGYMFLNNYLSEEFYIQQAQANLGSVEWNIETEFDYDDGNYQSNRATLEYTGNPIELHVVGDFTNFEVIYRTNDGDVDAVSINEAGEYYIYATISLKEEYQQNFYFDTYTLSLYLTIKVNPFETIAIDGVEISYNDFVKKEEFEYLSVITFTLKEGYTAYVQGEEASSFTIDRKIHDFVVSNESDNTVFSKYGFGNFYLIDEIIVEDKSFDVKFNCETYVKLGEDQTSFAISMDEKYLTKYASMLSYEICYNSVEPTRGIITTLPLVIENATDISSLRIILTNNEDINFEYNVTVLQYSLIKEISYTTVSLNEAGERTETLADNQYGIELNNSILVDLSVEVAEGYTAQIYGYDYEQTIDLTNLNNLENITIVVMDSNYEIVEYKYVYVNFTAFTENGYCIREIDNFNTTENEYSLTILNSNSDLVVSSLLNGRETIELIDSATVVNYVLTIEYDSLTYTYTKDFVIFKTISISECVNEETLYEGIFLTDSETGEKYKIDEWEPRIDLYEQFNASTINEFNLENLEFPVADGYEVSNKELVALNGDVYLKLTITKEGLASTVLTDNEYYIYILLEFDGDYNSDVSAQIRIFDLIEGYKDISSDVTEINIDISLQGLDVSLSNNYAKITLIDEERNTLLESKGYIVETYRFEEAGTYYLIITATDGTTKTYTINATGEFLPILEVVVGEITLTQNMGEYGPFEGDFEWQVLDDEGYEMSFTAVLGSDALSMVEDGKLTITSLRAALLASATIYNESGVEIETLENFNLIVLGDEGAEFVMFYAISTIQGQTTTSYIILYLTDSIPDQKVLEVVVGENTYSEYINSDMGMPYGDFEMSVLSDTSNGMEWMFTAYLGTYEEIPETLKLDSIYCFYDGVVTDLMSEQQILESENIVLTVGPMVGNEIPCVAYSILMDMSTEYGEYYVTIYVVLYLVDKSDIPYPAVITIGENSYNFKVNAMSFDFGDVEIDMDNYYFYIMESEEAMDLTEITITLDRVYSDYSYMVLIGDAYERYMEEVETKYVYSSDFINGLLADGTQAFRVTNQDNLTMTIPVEFVDGLAYFDIAVEGFVGYLEEDYVHDMTFVRVYIVIEGVGELPENENGPIEVPDNNPLAGFEFIITINNEKINSIENSATDQYNDIFVWSNQKLEDLKNLGYYNIETNTIRFDSFICPDNFYLYTIIVNEENGENEYIQLENGKYLSTYIVNYDEVGLVAQIFVYTAIEFSGELIPVGRINIVFADSLNLNPSPVEPSLKLSIEVNGSYYSIEEGNIIFDEINQYYYVYISEVEGDSETITIDSLNCYEKYDVLDLYNEELVDTEASFELVKHYNGEGIACVAMRINYQYDLYLFLE